MPKGEFKYATYVRTTKLIKSRFLKIQALVTDLQGQAEVAVLTDVQLRTLNAYSGELKRKRADYESNLHRIIESDSEEVEEDSLSADQDNINDLFVGINAVIDSLTPSSDDSLRSPGAESNLSAHTFTASSVRLPKLELKSFNGDPLNWVTWINVFDSSIHKNPSIPNISKFSYLLNTLSGEPLNLIKSLSLTSPNYLIAYNLLRERYHNLRRLTTLHLNTILDIPAISNSSVSQMRQFLNLIQEHTQSLKALSCDISTASNPLLSAHILRKLTQELRKKLETYRLQNTDDDHVSSHTLPDVREIIDFLISECNTAEDASLHEPPSAHKPQVGLGKLTQQKKAAFAPRSVSLVAAQETANSPNISTQNWKGPTTIPCFICNNTGHKVYQCELYKSKNPTERHQLIKANNRCFSCLGNHSIRDCKSRASCLICNRKHHTSLHFETRSQNESRYNSNSKFRPKTSQNEAQLYPAKGKSQTLSPEEGKSQSASDTEAVSLASYHSSRPMRHATVLLGTALVKLTSSNGQSHVFRALIDSGSQCDFVSERAVQLLSSRRAPSTLTVSGLSQVSSSTRGLTHLKLETLSGHIVASHHPMFILEKISVDMPRTKISEEVLKRVKPYVLADPSFHMPGSIDVLLGGALFPILLTHQTHSLGPNMPYVIGTQFGYVIIGQAPCEQSSHAQLNHSVAMLSTGDHNLHVAIQQFWQQEEPPQSCKKTDEELLCDQFFVSTHTRDPDGHYVVRLPFKTSHTPLGISRPAAEQRLASLERKFETQVEFHKLYSDFMSEYESLGHMIKIQDSSLSLPHYFLPHHGVLKESSSTTKLRAVFDASSKTSSGVSLNDILLTGRKLQSNICDILLHFRIHQYVFSCDIRQMYRQIKVHPDDHAYQLILWRNSKVEPKEIFKLTTVTYGLNCSPYLAMRTLHQLATDEGDNYPKAAKVLQAQTYIDDVIYGASSISEAQETQRQLIELLKCGGFELRKWSSNTPQLLHNLPQDHLESPVFLQESNQPHVSILGLHWSPEHDTFSYDLNLSQSAITKRGVLSMIAKIYDPCGFLAPCTMLAKCFMQLLWTTGIGWDDPLPHDLANKWHKFISEIPLLKGIQIPRSLSISSSGTVELHGFSDASESGYAAAIYLKSQLSNNDVAVCLVISKTRVAPLKRVTLPRLELCAAHLLAQLTTYCLSIFSDYVTLSQTHLWCDSSVVLSWLQTPSYRLKTYVANRVAQIQEAIPADCWHHILSGSNPSDCASRGILASQLISHPLWWSGPSWLQLPASQWPTSHCTPSDTLVLAETKETPLTVLVSTSQEEWELLTKFSSWPRLVMVMAYVLRFINNCRHSTQTHYYPHITTPERQNAQIRIFRMIQHAAFKDELLLLAKGTACSTRIQRLNPFISEDGLVRVGGRLQHSTLSLHARHPVILPKKHHVVDIMIDYIHRINLHAGPSLTQALLVRQVWILSMRSVIRFRIFKCIKCFKAKPRSQPPLMGDLPSVRVTPARPFFSTGLDYGGPFTIKVHNLKAIRHVKAYFCVFVCMATKAVHLEVVTDLTSESFIAALTRFVSRRGFCAHIYSDCGTNFVGADAILRKTVQALIKAPQTHDNIQNFTTSRGIHFHFNPPAAPHQGGLWESAVKSVKHHLKRVIGNTVLTLSEFSTLLCQIEAMLNSRPLTPLTQDPEDLSVLTPGHFLVGDSLTALPEPDLVSIPASRLKQWQLVQALQQRIWRKWQSEYLHTLQQRTKWMVQTKPLQVGDMVLLQTPSPPLTWPLARVTALHPGLDGTTRVVDLKTHSGNLTRPAVKVCPLPINI